MVKCSSCGREIPSTWTVCPFCGGGESKKNIMLNTSPIIYKPKPEDKYRAFENLNDPVFLEQIKLKLAFWDERKEEAIRTEYKIWSAREILDLIEAFGEFNVALQLGLPNELFDLFLDQISMSIFRPRKYWVDR